MVIAPSKPIRPKEHPMPAQPSPNAAAAAALATTYSIDIEMDDATAAALSGSYLYGFKAVQGPSTGMPLVWFQSTDISDHTFVTWDVQYQAYTSRTDIIPNGPVITASASYDIELGQTLNVTNKSTGTGAVDGTAGQEGAVVIHNHTTAPFTCGISQSQGTSKPAPMCAFPVHGGFADTIIPIEKVLLVFSSKPINTGAVIEKSESPAMLIDLTDAPGNARIVNFEIDNGWSWEGGASWGTAIPAQQLYVPLLITGN
jgi:hypothetical protein